MSLPLLVERPQGLYCPPGDFHIDPWQPVPRAVITHAHGDHARRGNGSYLAHDDAAGILRARLGDGISLQTLPYGEALRIGDVNLSLHPAGHVLGSAQIRIEHRGQVWVASGDYKLQPDPTCAPFEAVRCHTFVTESTFALPIYRWPDPATVRDELLQWWRQNADAGQCSVVYAYAFGKAQRMLHGLDAGIGPVFCHGAVEALNLHYRARGIALPDTRRPSDPDVDKTVLRRALVVAPPSAAGSPWMRRFGTYRDAFASGWMLLRGTRRRRGVDRGFVLSDHADWPGLQSAIAATGASEVIVTHGYVPVMVRWLREQGLQARAFRTEFGDDEAMEQAPEGGAP